jgi:hypothetical protein
MACVFHLGNTLLLNISFINHVPVYLMFFPLAKLTALRKVFEQRIPVAAALLLLGAAQIVQNVAGIRLQLDGFAALVIAVLVWPIAVVAIGACIYKEKDNARSLDDVTHVRSGPSPLAGKRNGSSIKV